MVRDHRSVCVPPGTPIKEAVRRIDESSMQIALVVDDQYTLLGTATDGDVRRAILEGIALDQPISRIMNPHPIVANVEHDHHTLLAMMTRRNIHQLPVVDHARHVMGLYILDDLLRPEVLPNPVLLMAGGMGTRLVPLTNDCPKPMLPVGGRPILETILMNFVEQGFREFWMAVNHKSEMILDHFGDGSRFGVSIQYLRETEKLGTAGALNLLPAPPQYPMIVMNGDVLTKVNFRHLVNFHEQQQSAATICVREFEFQVPYGVIRMNGVKILAIEEKPTQRFFVNAGIYVLSPDVLKFVPPGVVDMPTVFEKVVAAERNTAVFPVREYWVDIGQHTDFARANGEFQAVFK